MNPRNVSLYAGVLFVAIIVLAIYWLGTSHPIPNSNLSVERANIESLFQKQTPVQAYEQFKKEHEKDDVETAHTVAHLFGEVLYEHTGLAGFSICDGSFGFGCYHSFLGRAIADHGKGVVSELDDACVKAYGTAGLGCSHGIGHGILSYYGYGRDDLLTSLDLCETLSWKRLYGGCRDGVFMEYNFRIMESDPEKRSRPFSAEIRQEPCTVVPEQFRVACYFNQPQWWANALKAESNIARKMSGFCEEVQNVEQRKACFRGIGYSHAPEVKFDAVRGTKFCDEITAPLSGRLWCREGLAWALYADPVFRPQAEMACTLGLKESEAKQCKQEYLFVLQ